MPTRKPYAATAVPAERSMGAIIELLRARKIDSRWTTLIGPPEGLILQMIWKHEGSQIRARIEVKIAVPATRAIPKQRYRHLTPAARRGAPSMRALTEKQQMAAAAAERKRVLRVLAYDAPREMLLLQCGRRVERQAQATAAGHPSRSENIYSLWEPIIGSRQYGVASKGWGLAHTLRPSVELPYDDAVGWELAQQKRAMDVLCGNVVELSEIDVLGKVLRSCGRILLLGEPRSRAELVMAARRARPCG